MFFALVFSLEQRSRRGGRRSLTKMKFEDALQGGEKKKKRKNNDDVCKEAVS